MGDDTPTSPRGADDTVPDVASKAGGGIGCLLLFGILFAGCYAMLDFGDDTDSGEPSRDRIAESACGRFVSVLRDARAGILTDQELRTELKGVYDHGRVADDERVAQASQDLLAAVTSGSADDLLTATMRMSEACENHL